MGTPRQLQAQLKELLLTGHRHAENPELQPLQRATIARQLYSNILARPEWQACYLPNDPLPSTPAPVPSGASAAAAAAAATGGASSSDSSTISVASSATSSTSAASTTTPGPRIPSWDNLHEWLAPANEGFGPDQIWSLYETQKAVEERYKRAGKITRRPKPGAVCGKVLQRFDRTYICK